MAYDKLYMRNMLDRCFSQEGRSMIPRSALDYTSRTSGDWNPIKDALSEWELLGWLRIIDDPEFAEDDQYCVEMLTFMGGEEFPENWISDTPKKKRT